MTEKNRRFLIYAALALGIVLHLSYCAIAVTAPDRLLRPDSGGYLEPAAALAQGAGYPTTTRPPGYPLLAAAVYVCGGDNAVLAFIGTLSAIGACAVTGLAAGEYGGKKCGIIAALLALFNLTVIANAPLLLSDSWFFLFAALQLWLFVLFYRRNDCRMVWGCAAIAAWGTLIRPINQLFILPLVVLIFIHPVLPLRKKFIAAGISCLIFAALVLPWMYRNYHCGATFAIDTNTGAMRHQNGAMLMAEVNGTDFESEKSRLLAEEQQLTFPDVRSHENWRIREFKSMVISHPFIYFKQHFNWQILLPDAPSFLENLGVTTANRGTMGVLKRDGVLTACRHYFGSNWWIYPAILLPLLLVVLLLYGASLLRLIIDIKNYRRNWREIVVFLAFCEYYFFLPGAITAPRYQLPALPFLCTLAACMISHYVEKTAAEN